MCEVGERADRDHLSVENESVKYTGFFIRSVANLIDIPILFLFLLSLGHLMNFLGIALPKYGFVRNIVIWLYLGLFISSKYQATPGKMVFGIYVIKKDGGG